MIPQGGIPNRNVRTAQQPSRTYRIDTVNNRIIEMVDDLDAVKQAISKILQTERNEHRIYSSNYGIDTLDIIGKDETIALSHLNRNIREALLQDDRVKDVQDMRFTRSADELTVTFTVVTQFGNFQEQKKFTD